MLAAAAADSGRQVTLVELLGQGADHPEVLTIPETGYLKGAVLRIGDGSPRLTALAEVDATPLPMSFRERVHPDPLCPQ